jgi:16S rRNA (cytosine967-C5)-methyltransferase
VRNILRLGLYQIFYMDKVPASAACNEMVEITKRHSHPGTVKFVNAVLRTAAREPEKAAFPSGSGHAVEELALRTFHPQWLVKLWSKEFGFSAAEKLCAFDNEDAPLCFRTNTLKTTREALLQELSRPGRALRGLAMGAGGGPLPFARCARSSPGAAGGALPGAG